MKKIEIAFADFWGGWNPTDNFIYNLLKKKYDVEISDNPDYLFFSNFNGQIEHFRYDDCVKIFYTPENLCPDFNLADYAMGFEYLDFGDRYFRVPNYLTKPQYKQAWLLMEHKHEISAEQVSKYAQRDFCSFVVSNGDANPIRKTFFEKLSDYKKVDSGGRYLNNIGLPKGVPDKLEFDRKHKFTLTFENTSHPGYTTEKVIEGFAAKTVPIYWGDPRVGELFNKKAFIDVSDFASMEQAIRFIEEIDQDNERYTEMLREPALKCSFDWESFEKSLLGFLTNIIEQSKATAFRRNRELWGEIYTNTQKYGCQYYHKVIDNKIARGVRKLTKGK